MKKLCGLVTLLMALSALALADGYRGPLFRVTFDCDWAGRGCGSGSGQTVSTAVRDGGQGLTATMVGGANNTTLTPGGTNRGKLVNGGSGAAVGLPITTAVDPHLNLLSGASYAANTYASGYYSGVGVTYLGISNETLSDPAEWPDVDAHTPVRTNHSVVDPMGGTAAGTSVAVRLDDQDGTFRTGIRSATAGIAADTSLYTATVWFSCTSVTTIGQIQIMLTGGATQTGSADLTCDTANRWFKTSVSVSNDNSNNAATVLLYPLKLGAGTGPMDFAHPQLWNSSTAGTGFAVPPDDPALVRANVSTTATKLSYATFVFGNRGTVCGWFNVGGNVITSSYLWALDDATPGGVRLELKTDNKGDVIFDSVGLGTTQITLDTSSQVLLSAAGSRNYWHHVCAVWDQSDATSGNRTAHLYVDGAEPAYTTNVGAGVGQVGAFGDTLFVGEKQDGTAQLNGFISRLEYWDRNLSLDEVKTDMNLPRVQ